MSPDGINLQGSSGELKPKAKGIDALHICSWNLQNSPLNLLSTSVMWLLSYVRTGNTAPALGGGGNVITSRITRLISELAVFCLWLADTPVISFFFFALVSGGRAEKRRRAQVRPLVYGAARIHRGVCPRARSLPAHGTRHGGGQEVPVSCKSLSLLCSGWGVYWLVHGLCFSCTYEVFSFY